MAIEGVVYQLRERTEQAPGSSVGPGAANPMLGIWIELQVISYLLHRSQGSIPEDLRMLRESFAASITS